MAFGRLQRSEAPRPMAEINVTPLVDVMLVLVVILIVTAPLMASALRLDLPTADGARPSDAPRFVTVGIDAAGQLFLDDEPVDATQLGQRLQQVAKGRADTEVQLRADQGVPYRRIVEVMAAAQKAGLNRIGFIAQPGTP